MKICVECKQPERETCKSICKHCGLKIDKYKESSTTFKIIDIILLKQTALRHQLINQPRSVENILTGIILLIISGMAPHISNIEISQLRIGDSAYVDLFYENFKLQIVTKILYFICLKLMFWRICIFNIFYILTILSFFNYFRIAFSLWKYSEIRYFMIADILGVYSEICCIECLDSRLNVYSKVIFAKIVSIVSVIVFYRLFFILL